MRLVLSILALTLFLLFLLGHPLRLPNVSTPSAEAR